MSDEFGSKEAIAVATIYFSEDERNEIEIDIHTKGALDDLIKAVSEIHAEHKTFVHFEDEPNRQGEQTAHIIPQRRIHHIKIVKNISLVDAAELHESLTAPSKPVPVTAPGVSRPVARSPHVGGTTPHTSAAVPPEHSGFLVGGADAQPATPPSIPITEPVGAHSNSNGGGELPE